MGMIPKKRDYVEHPLMSLRDEMNRLFDSFWRGDFLPERFGFTREWPKVDVTETDDSVIVCAEVPGLEAKDIDVAITGDVLTIKGFPPRWTSRRSRPSAGKGYARSRLASSKARRSRRSRSKANNPYS